METHYFHYSHEEFEMESYENYGLNINREDLLENPKVRMVDTGARSSLSASDDDDDSCYEDYKDCKEQSNRCHPRAP